MRALRLLVIVLGVLLLGGTLALVVAIIMRSPRPAESRRPDPQPADSAKQAPYDTVVDLPAGAVIQSIQPAGDRVLLHLVLPSGRQQLVVLDPGSGLRRGTIELRPGQ
jgi:hypothetical protein